ncbi:TonB-linked outer membrane protein, SusC/RagA family [Mucilaginibacter pineti]|uniref:TonB-linked outer membrane protein, SusC/RagA family n=1 Tax=Mucilaginibacter pineti TaxID=1391627 RepID=A0A1G6WV17_9SPHI|nr:SusC/RagA family TonB-linked outer membrane protein [Mucilaginibacter pineti]SDD69780.1 TonB-linked outer membrane protein, SusC/RagA family [Mucilaginibacter pineti]
MKLTFLYNAVCAIRAVKYKFLLVLKITTILLLVGAMHLSAATYSQTVSISKKNTNLESVFKNIKQQTGYLFFYSGKVNLSGKTLNIDLKDVSLEEALTTCLKNYNLTYNIVDKTIVIRNKAPEDDVISAVNAVMNKQFITGKVIDSVDKAAIPGVNISLKNSKGFIGQTNATGDFVVSADIGDVLVFSFIGYKPKEVKVDGKPIVVKLSPQVNAIGDVVVTGYQVIKKDNYTGSAIIVKGDDLKRVNPNNLIQSLATFDPSFRIDQNNLLGSDPNAMPKINVRGSTTLPSINGDIIDRNNLSSSYNLPIFMLDGFSVSLQKVTDLDINRIASITILKDAAATAVYGSRAANGVIVITTKAPIAGKLQVQYNYDLTVTAPDLTDYHVLNAKDKLQYEKLAGLYSAVNNTANTQDELDQQYYSKLKNVVSGVNTYWLSQPLRNTFGHAHSLYAEGGDTTFRYGVNLRYQNTPGVMKGSTRNRYSGGMNFNYNPTRNLLFKNEVTVTQVDGVNSKYGNFADYVAMNPYYPIRDDSGNILREVANWKVDTHQSGAAQYKSIPVYNPLFEAGLGNFDKSGYLEVLDNFSIDWKLTPALRLIGLISVNDSKSTADTFVSPFSNSFFNGPTADIQNRGSYTYTASNSLSFDGNIRFVYNKQIGDNSVNAVFGSNVTSSKSDYKSFQARGFSNDKFTNIGFARTYTPDSAPGGDVSNSRLVGTFFNTSYAFKNRYLLDASFRLDGSSSFGANQRFAPFWAGGIGWNLHNESFMHENFPAISRFKLTATAGLTGSVDFPPYLSKTTYTYQTSNWYSTGIGALVNGYGNENLKWQKTTEYDYGLDMGLFNDRVLINPRYYHKLTKGLLTDINIAPSTGYTTYKENLGDMSNNGYELYVVVNAYKSKDLNVNFTGNLAHNKNTIVKISNSLKSYNQSVDDYQSNPDNNAQGRPLLRFNEGQSLNTIYAVKSKGIDPENGKEIFIKRDGSLTYVYDIADTQPVGDETPKVEGFFGSSVTYKQFLLSFSFHYQLGGETYNQTLVDRVENADPRFNVDSRALDQRWKQPGDVTFYKNIADLGTSFASSRFVQKVNLVELKSVYLSYDLKKSVAQKLGMRTLRAGITANDIFRASSIEIERGIQYPYARSLTCSLTATF